MKNSEIQIKFKDELLKKNEQIIQLNKKINQCATGGDNYPIITESIDHTNSICHFSINNYGDKNNVPLYDVYALIIDLDEKKIIEDSNDLTLPQMITLSEQKAVTRINVGYLPGVAGLKHLLSVNCPPQILKSL